MGDMIYLDNSATTPVAPEVLETMLPFHDLRYGNASSLHASGRAARKAVDDSRETVAELLGANADEIVFTSGATEANNLALFGSVWQAENKHIIISKIEHDAVLHTAQWLVKQGCEVTELDVDDTGRVDVDVVRAALRSDTGLVSIMAGNNEIGTLQPIREIGALCQERGIRFHTDAVQAFGKVDVPTDVIDLLSLSAHKFHGPKGVDSSTSAKAPS